MSIGAAATRLLFALEPEQAHKLSLTALKTGLLPAAPPAPDPRLSVTVAGLRFPNPLGMAAGYDKDAEVPDALLRLGFGFAEVGTITPLAQAGNPRPRIFRLPGDSAVINRLGFNNGGHDAAYRQLSARRSTGIVGINIGANKDSTDRIGDYAAGAKRFARLASYLTVNISSPNTPGLRNLQSRAALSELLSRVREARADSGAHPPIFLKIAPDLDADEMTEIAQEVLAHEIEGLIVSNTTLSRDHVSGAQAAESGGLSGKPLFARSTAVLARMRRLVGPGLAIIGAGGVSTAEDALEKIRAGADLVQLYTGMIYGGPGLPARIVRGLARYCTEHGVASIALMRDQSVQRWAETPLSGAS